MADFEVEHIETIGKIHVLRYETINQTRREYRCTVCGMVFINLKNAEAHKCK